MSVFLFFYFLFVMKRSRFSGLAGVFAGGMKRHGRIFSFELVDWLYLKLSQHVLHVYISILILDFCFGHRWFCVMVLHVHHRWSVSGLSLNSLCFWSPGRERPLLLLYSGSVLSLQSLPQCCLSHQSLNLQNQPPKP